MNLLIWLIIALGVVLGIGLGIFLHWGWVRRHAGQRQRIPSEWLLNPRGLVTTDEQKVWNWLREVFPDHVVMVKVPVMRFTLPSSQTKGNNWHELLNNVYCTFTVAATDGKVVGCLDVPTKRGPTKSQREMKEDLLAACYIEYSTVRGSDLPSAQALRAAFLGDAEIMEMAEVVHKQNYANEETQAGEGTFHEALGDFTREKVRMATEAAVREVKGKGKDAPKPDVREKNRDVGFNPEGTGSFLSPREQRERDRFAVPFEDSFNMPADTRPAKLS